MDPVAVTLSDSGVGTPAPRCAIKTQASTRQKRDARGRPSGPPGSMLA